MASLAEQSDASSNAYLARRRRLQEVINERNNMEEAYMSIGDTPMIANVDGIENYFGVDAPQRAGQKRPVPSHRASIMSDSSNQHAPSHSGLPTNLLPPVTATQTLQQERSGPNASGYILQPN